MLELLKKTNELKHIMRWKATLSKNGDSAADHSWHLAFTVLVVATELDLPINISYAIKLALVHNLAEIITDDLDAYEIMTNVANAEERRAAEDAAMRQLLQGTSVATWLLPLWEAYRAQKTPEAKLVRALNKMEGFIHLIQSGAPSYSPKEFHGDFCDAAVDAFDASLDFPSLQPMLENLKSELKHIFEEQGVAWFEKKANMTLPL